MMIKINMIGNDSMHVLNIVNLNFVQYNYIEAYFNDKHNEKVIQTIIQ